MGVLCAHDRQVARNHREPHVPVLAVERHVPDIGIGADQPRVEALYEVHQSRAVRAEIRAAVDLVARLHARLLAEPREALQGAAGTSDRVPVVVARRVLPEPQLQPGNAGQGAGLVQPRRIGRIWINHVHRGRREGTRQAHLLPAPHGCLQRAHRVVRVDRVTLPDIDVDAVVAELDDLAAQLLDRQRPEELRIEDDVHASRRHRPPNLILGSTMASRTSDTSVPTTVMMPASSTTNPAR